MYYSTDVPYFYVRVLWWPFFLQSFVKFNTHVFMSHTMCSIQWFFVIMLIVLKY